MSDDGDMNGERRFKPKKKPANWKRPQTSRARKGLCCGAFSRRTGRECRQAPEWPSPRCRQHGGRSTGPKTEAGRKVISEMRKREWAEWRQQVGITDPDWRYGSTWLSRRRRETASDYLAKHGRWKPEEPT
jgi:hypothetical protein